MSNLVIVESPTKAKTLSRFLGKEYQIEATMGHIRDLPEKKLGIEIKIKNQKSKIKNTDSASDIGKEEYEFIPQYQVITGRKEKIKELKKLSKRSKKVILATDPDREGEAIAWHVIYLLAEGGKEKKDISSRYSRIVFHEITESAVKEALFHPRVIDMHLVDAQQGRRILDRLVGYKLSPLLWNKLGMRWLSAGRVQTVAVRFIVEREREIEKFQPTQYFTIEGIFTFENGEIRANLASKNDVSYEGSFTFNLFDGKYTVTKTSISKRQQAEEIIKDFQPPWTVTLVEKKEIKKSPPPPFMTSTLQQEAGRRFYFSSKKTMQLAQKLYEEGYITYHRTDSFNLSEKFITSARSFIEKNYGIKYLPSSARKYYTKSKVAQEAHEAIRPTDIFLKAENISEKKDLFKDHLRLYEMIWRRALACQAADAIFDSTTIDILDDKGYQFETKGSIVKFDGFLKIIGREFEEKIIPDVVKGQRLDLSSTEIIEHWTSPPPRYTEASLIKTLEEKGIGRPSTYAPIISTIEARKYVEKIEKKFQPTRLGIIVVDFLIKYFPDIFEILFTAKMEDELDDIANGKLGYNEVLSDFYAPFNFKLEKVFKEAERVKMDLGETDEKCPKCGEKLVIRLSKFGKFFACSAYPKCKYTKNILETVGIQCPCCGSEMVVKKTRRGKQFYGCSSYPKCNFAAWKKEDIK